MLYAAFIAGVAAAVLFYVLRTMVP